jgi:hypothetical protein
MKKQLHWMMPAALVLGLIASLPTARAKDDKNGPTVPVRTLVTITSKNGPPQITKADVLVMQDKTRLVVTDLQPATGQAGALQLAILIDDATNSSLDNQLKDIANFIRGLDSNAKVGIFYAQNATVQVVQDFTADHDRAANALRIPLGRGAAYSSIYLSMMDLMKRWPQTQDRREIFLISDGIDRFRGDPFSPDIAATYTAAQKNGIMLHTIFANGFGPHARNQFRISWGQNNLGQITDETGGESYFQGYYTPVDFAPFMAQFNKVLNSQYWVSYLARAKNKPGLQRIRFSTELPGVEISAPNQVWISAAQ